MDLQIEGLDVVGRVLEIAIDERGFLLGQQHDPPERQPAAGGVAQDHAMLPALAEARLLGEEAGRIEPARREPGRDVAPEHLGVLALLVEELCPQLEQRRVALEEAAEVAPQLLARLVEELLGVREDLRHHQPEELREHQALVVGEPGEHPVDLGERQERLGRVDGRVPREVAIEVPGLASHEVDQRPHAGGVAHVQHAHRHAPGSAARGRRCQPPRAGGGSVL
jgi:hypothetical protein